MNQGDNTFQNMGKDKKGWLRGGNHSHATCLLESLWVFFFSFKLISQLHSVAPTFAQTDMREIVHQCYKWSSSYSTVVCCHTDFILILAAWNTWLRVSSWEPCLKSEVKSGGFFSYFWYNIFETHVLNSGNFCYFIFLDKGSSKKSSCMCCSVC